MYFLLNCINPKYILDINWISREHCLYKVWTAKNTNSKFVVIQHGSYVGGIVTDKPHSYTNCDIFLTWGPFFVEQFEEYNSGKKVKIINFGNPIYNEFNRMDFIYKNSKSNKILLLPTALDSEGVSHINTLIKKIKLLGFEVFIKEHGKQGKEKEKNGSTSYPSIENVEKYNGQLYSILQDNDYDFIISDHSSALLDAIFFKNKVLYFDPDNIIKDYSTNYSDHLTNLFSKEFNKMSKCNFYKLLNIENQESLFNNMITIGNNQID
jgi:hypothetical protein